MKRTLPLLLSAILVLFVLPLSTGFASPAGRPSGDPALNFAPGSIVRFEHLSIEDGLSQNAHQRWQPSGRQTRRP